MSADRRGALGLQALGHRVHAGVEQDRRPRDVGQVGLGDGLVVDGHAGDDGRVYDCAEGCLLGRLHAELDPAGGGSVFLGGGGGRRMVFSSLVASSRRLVVVALGG